MPSLARPAVGLLTAVAFSLVAWCGSATAQQGADATPTQRSCASLSGLTNFQFSIDEARVEPASAETPEHCRVYGRILPDIRFAVYLPADWTGRLTMRGNGGWSGSIPENQMQYPLREGSVSVGTDTGHDRRRERGARFARDHQKLIDFAYRSVHLTVVAAKQIAAAYYRQPIQHSYFVGCSQGGRQGLMAAQRFPDDFDGLVVGAPILDFVGASLHGAWEALIMERVAFGVEQLESNWRSWRPPFTGSATGRTASKTASSRTHRRVASMPRRICPSAMAHRREAIASRRSKSPP